MLMEVPVIDCIPEGATYRYCYFDYQTRSICLLVEHPSFAPVRDGERPPEINGWDAEIEIKHIRVVEVDHGTHTQEENPVHGAGVGG